jgi:hypothetical protein
MGIGFVACELQLLNKTGKIRRALQAAGKLDLGSGVKGHDFNRAAKLR